MTAQIVSKERVAAYGEVLTGSREVNAMLDLVSEEAGRIESRFLEPACGNGNFLVEVLARKLGAVESRYRRSQVEYERYAVLAVTSVYGIDLLEDNVEACRDRLFRIFEEVYRRLFGVHIKPACLASVRYILKRNIIHGDALTLRTVGGKPGPIVFAEWSPVNGTLLKRRDFSFQELLEHQRHRELPLFSDLGEEVFLPVAEKEYPPVHFLELADD